MKRLLLFAAVVLVSVPSPFARGQGDPSSEPFDLEISPKLRPPAVPPVFQVTRVDASWVTVDDYHPELRLTLVFNRVPFLPSLMAGLRLLGWPVNEPRWVIRAVRSTDDVTILQLGCGPDEYARPVAHHASLHLSDIVTAPGVPNHPIKGGNRIAFRSIRVTIPAAPRSPFRVTDWDHHLSAGSSVLEWTFNRPASRASLHEAIRVNGQAIPGLSIAAPIARNGGHLYRMTIPALAPGRNLVSIEGAESEGWNEEMRQRTNHQFTVDIPVAGGARLEEDRRSYGSGRFGADLYSYLRTDRRSLERGNRVEMSAEVGHRTTGKLFGARFRALSAVATARATSVANPSSLSGRFEASITFGEGRLSYTWTPVDHPIRRNLAFDRNHSETIFSASTTIPVGPIPVALSTGASLDLRIRGRVGLHRQDRPVVDSGLEGTLSVSASLRGWGRALVGISFMGVEVGVGVEGNLTLARAGLAGTLLVTLRSIDCFVDFEFSSSLELSLVARVHIPLPWPFPDIRISKRATVVDVVLAEVSMRLFRIRQ
ncbi:MAG: hypothetical protein HY720_23730 [Planctomycetes bacterium]|nr:hypothetical protein [Planctomycetota bacterium]